MTQFKFKIDNKFNQLVNFHVSQTKKDKNDYLRISQSEYHLFKEHINCPKNILELGCGLGRMSIFLNHNLGANTSHFILADSTDNINKRKDTGGWVPEGGFYNNLKLTAKFCEIHNLYNFEIFDLQNKNLNTLSNIDFVMSFLSVGFHYLIEQYLPTLLNITVDDVVMVFGVRRGQYKKKYFYNYFNFVDIKSNPLSFKRGLDFKEDILILKDKK